MDKEVKVVEEEPLIIEIKEVAPKFRKGYIKAIVIGADGKEYDVWVPGRYIIWDTVRYGRVSGLGKGRPLPEGETAASWRRKLVAERIKEREKRREQERKLIRGFRRTAEDDAAEERVRIAEQVLATPPSQKTDLKDLKNMREARSLLFLLEETRNEYSDEVIREISRIRAAADRIIKEHEGRKKP